MSREKWSRRDLEKLLTPGETPSPPADLAARIKAEIPDRLPVAQAPGGAAGGGSSSRLGPWLLAASLVVTLGGGLLAYLTMRQAPLGRAAGELSRPVLEEDRGAGPAEGPKLEQALSDTGPQAAPPPAPAQEPADRRLRQEVAQRADRAREDEPEARGEKLEARNEKTGDRAGEEAQAEPAEQAEAEVRAQLEALPEPAPATASEAVPPAAGPERSRRQGAREQALRAPAAARKVHLADTDREAATGAPALLRPWIVEAGQLPPPEVVRVGELVAEFDPGVPPPPPGSGEVFALHAEGAPGPFTPGARFRMVRFAVVAGPAAGEGGGGRPDSGARVRVEFDPRGVAGWRLAGEEEPSPPARPLSLPLEGPRWVALVEIELQPGIPAETPLATLRLRLPSAAAGGDEPARLLRLADLAASWREATPALRLASLAAELGEILGGSPVERAQALEALAGEARELAAESPGDVRAAELADLAARAAALARAGEAPEGN